MSIIYDREAENSEELRKRADDLLTMKYHHQSEIKNNVNMLCNMLGHTMIQLADALDAIERLQRKTGSH